MSPRISKNREFGEIRLRRDSLLVSEQALWCHDNERFAVFAVHLPAQDVKILSGRGEIADLHVFLSAKLEEAFEPRARVFGSLAFVAVGKKQDNGARTAPFGFRRRDELIDDDLRPVGEISKLRFPQIELGRKIHRVAVIETEDGIFREWAVIDAKLGLVGAKMIERDIALAIFFVVEHAVALAERAATAILAGKPHRSALEKERAEGERLGKGPVVGTASLPDLEAPLEQDALDLWQHIETLPELWSALSR